MKNILLFGDSLTAGYGLPNKDQESFPALIQQKIRAAQLDYNVINAGLSGDTSAGGLNRLDYWLSSPVAVFVLELGINDIIRGIPPDSTFKNLQAIINKVKTKYPDVKIALMGMEISAVIPDAFAIQFKDIFIKLAAKNKIAFMPFFLHGVAGKAHLNLLDRLHPSAEGYKVVADNVWQIIKNYSNRNDIKLIMSLQIYCIYAPWENHYLNVISVLPCTIMRSNGIG